MSKRASSSPRPLIGSKAVMVICLRSSLCSAIAHKLEGGLEQKKGLLRGTVKINSGDPPVIGTRMSGCRVEKLGLGKTSMMTHLPSGLTSAYPNMPAAEVIVALTSVSSD